MDLHEVAEALAGPEPRIRLRQGAVSSIQSDGTITVTIAGSTTAIAGVRCLASVCPIVGAAVWLATDGADVFALGTITTTGPAYCSVTRTNDGTLGTGTWYELSFATNTRTDPYGMWSSGAADRITCVTPGIYLLTGQVTYEANGTGRRDCRLLVNGSSIVRTYEAAYANLELPISVATVYPLAVGDYVQLGARQSSGGNLSVRSGGADGIRIAAQWLRPVV